jgi:hypothetical protein
MKDSTKNGINFFKNLITKRPWSKNAKIAFGVLFKKWSENAKNRFWCSFKKKLKLYNKQ